MAHTDTSADLLGTIAQAAGRLGIATSTLCVRAANDGKIFKRLETGKSVKLPTYDRIMAWIAQNAPEPEIVAQ